MGLCASTENTSSPAGGGRGSPGSNSKDSLNRKTTLDAENVTERAVELILEAKSRRMVVADTTNIKISPDFVFPCFPKSESKKRFIKSSLGKNFFLFQELETQSQHKMIEAMGFTIKEDEMEEFPDDFEEYKKDSNFIFLII